MLSIRASICIFAIKKMFNINPARGDQAERMGKFATKDRYKAPMGYARTKVVLDNNVPIEIVDPRENKNNNLIFVIHGGGYIVGMSDVYRNLAKRYSKAGRGARVAFLDYRLAPEYKYPCALEDALAGWDWVLRQGYNPKDVTVIGDSAGGNLTLALMLKLREMKKELPGALVLISPWTDMTASGESYIKNFKDDALFGGKQEVTLEMKEQLINSPIYAFIGDADRKDPLISPALASFEGFPKSLILVGSHEILMDDSLTIVKKMKDAGVEVELLVGQGMFHIWPMFFRLFPEAEKAMKAICSYIYKSYESR